MYNIKESLSLGFSVEFPVGLNVEVAVVGNAVGLEVGSVAGFIVGDVDGSFVGSGVVLIQDSNVGKDVGRKTSGELSTA